MTATHATDESATDRVREYVRFGASPRAAQALVLGAKVRALLDQRVNVSFRDLRAVARPSLRHRLVLSYQAQMDQVTPDDLIDELLAAVPEVMEEV